MEIEINENIKIWREFNPAELTIDPRQDRFLDTTRNLARLLSNKERIAIRGRWFDVLTPSELVRQRNESDGYYRVVYIQINWESGEYYVGKANRPTWSQLKRYQGSGLKFTNKFKTKGGEFVRYYIARCKTAQETEQLEASIVDEILLSDEKCLNLVRGGGGTSEHPSIAETSEKKREHMKNHPEQYRPMLEASRIAFRSGDTAALRERNRRIKETMSAEKYREITRDRIAKWRNANPEGYAEARKKNSEKIKSPDSQAKRISSFKKWAEENPEKYAAWQERLIISRTSKTANEKRKASLKEWREKHPQQAQENAKKRARAAAAKISKEVNMMDLETGNVLKVFPSLHAAAKWLVENGKAKNKNCVSSISAVCLRTPCTTGYGFRKKAYGYDWRFKTDVVVKAHQIQNME